MSYPYSVQPVHRQTNGPALTGFILSLIGMFLCVPLIFVALAFCFVGLKREPKGLAVAGVVICLTAFVIWTIAAVLSFTVFAVPVIACLGFASSVYEAEEERVQVAYQDHPIVVRELGGIDWVEVSLNEAGQYKEGNEHTMVFNVRGPKGSGKIVEGTQYESDGQRIKTRLIVAGQSWELSNELQFPNEEIWNQPELEDPSQWENRDPF